MRSQEELIAALREQPDSFDTLYEYCMLLSSTNEYTKLFSLSERGVAIYETTPELYDIEQMRYFDLKRICHQLKRDHLDALVGESWPLVDLRWQPVFKLGRPREIAWQISHKNLAYLPAALHSDQLKRLRFLSITIADCTEEVLNILSRFRFEPLRVMNMCFLETPSVAAYQNFWNNAATDCGGLTSLSVRMPRLTDDHAIITRQALPHLESLSLLSLDRNYMTIKLCDFLADDPHSVNLMNLALIGTCFGDKGLLSLLTSEHFANLQTLDLHDGTLTNAAARLINADYHMPQLRNLDVRHNMIDPAGIDALQRARIQVACSDQHTRPAGRI